MYARVVKWDGGSADAIRQSTEGIKADTQSGPPEGVPAKGLLVLVDPDDGRCIVVSLFETEEDLRTGDATLNSMSPSVTMGNRAPVESYEVAVDVRF